MIGLWVSVLRDGALDAQRGGRRTFIQGARFAIVGALTNGAVLVIFWLLLREGVSPQAAATVCYATGVIVSFMLNRKWSFGDLSGPKIAFVRYVIVSVTGYAFIMAMHEFMPLVGSPPLATQIIAVFIVSIANFFALKLFVFPGARA